MESTLAGPDESDMESCMTSLSGVSPAQRIEISDASRGLEIDWFDRLTWRFS